MPVMSYKWYKREAAWCLAIALLAIAMAFANTSMEK